MFKPRRQNTLNDICLWTVTRDVWVLMGLVVWRVVLAMPSLRHLFGETLEIVFEVKNVPTHSHDPQ